MDQISEPLPSGHEAGAAHSFRLRVAFADTDAGGVMHHAAYLVFAERGRTEMMRDLGFSQIGLQQRGIVFAVRTCMADFLRPAMLDDLLDVRSAVRHLGASSLDIDQGLWRESAGDEGPDVELARLSLRLVCVGERGRPCRIPFDLRNSLAASQAGRGE